MDPGPARAREPWGGKDMTGWGRPSAVFEFSAQRPGESAAPVNPVAGSLELRPCRGEGKYAAPGTVISRPLFDHIEILGATTSKFGFPSEIVDDPLLDLVLPEPEEFDHAEERRLFYVAMTRARKTVTVSANREAVCFCARACRK